MYLWYLTDFWMWSIERVVFSFWHFNYKVNNNMETVMFFVFSKQICRFSLKKYIHFHIKLAVMQYETNIKKNSFSTNKIVDNISIVWGFQNICAWRIGYILFSFVNWLNAWAEHKIPWNGRQEAQNVSLARLHKIFWSSF